MKSIYTAIGAALFTLCACTETASRTAPEVVDQAAIATLAGVNLPDTTIDFLWWNRKFDPILNDNSTHTMLLNEGYLKSMTDQERAAIGYIATFIGSQCWWDGGYVSWGENNLDCKVITALGLGYQCSQTHLGFLRRWFSAERDILSELEQSNCPMTPYTDYNQSLFRKIVVKTKGVLITVYYEASGVSMEEQETWEWSETVYFLATSDNVRLVKREKSEVVRESFEWPEFSMTEE